MVANGSEPREISYALDPGAYGCEFDLEVDRECSPRVERLELTVDMMGLAEEPVQHSAAIGGRSSSYSWQQ